MLTKNESPSVISKGELSTQSNDPNDSVSAVGGYDGGPKRPRAILVVLGYFIRISLQLILMVGVLAGSYVAMNNLISGKPEVRKRPRFRTVYAVQTEPVILKDHQPTFIVYGETAASRSVDLRSLVSGEITFVNERLQIGNKIAAGEALVGIDRFNYEGALREAKANRNEALARISENEARILMENNRMRSANEQLELAKSDHQRIKALISKGTTTQKQLDDRLLIMSQRGQSVDQYRVNLEAENAKMQQLTASLERLDWRIQQAERNLQNTILKAPFDGVIRSSSVEIGKTLNANDVAVSIYEDKNIDVRFTLSNERFGRLQSDANGLIGRDIKVVWAIGGQEFDYPAKISRIGAEISSKRGGVEVYAALQPIENNPAIRPGAFVEIQVPDKVFSATALIPESAIYDGNHVYIKQNDRLISKSITIHAYDGGQVIVSGDIGNEDRILTTRIAEIGDGIRVSEEGSAKKRKREKGTGN